MLCRIIPTSHTVCLCFTSLAQSYSTAVHLQSIPSNYNHMLEYKPSTESRNEKDNENEGQVQAQGQNHSVGLGHKVLRMF